MPGVGVWVVGKDRNTADGSTKPKPEIVAFTKAVRCSREVVILSIRRPRLRSMCDYLLVCNGLWALISFQALFGLFCRSTFLVCFVDQILQLYEWPQYKKIFSYRSHLNCGSWTNSINLTLGTYDKCRLQGPTPNLANQNLYFNKIPSDSFSNIKVWKALV